MFKNHVWKSWLVIAILGMLFVACSDAAFVEEVTFVNDTEYSAHVEVTNGNRDGWLDLTEVPPESTKSITDVIDQGETWIFRFGYVGKHQEEVRISRNDLEESDWRVEIPESFAAALRELDVPPPP